MGQAKELLVDIKPKLLPESLRGLTDPTMPLPKNVSFIPLVQPLPGFNLWLGLAALVFTLFSGFFTGRAVVKHFTAPPAEPSVLYGGLIVTGISLAFTLGMFVQYLRTKACARALDQGRFREGFLLHPDFLLLNLDGRATLIPRDLISGIKWRRVGLKDQARIECWAELHPGQAEFDTVQLPNFNILGVSALSSWASREPRQA